MTMGRGLKSDKQSKILDIALAAGVSTATVSRVFSRHPYVSDDIRTKVLKIAKRMNYAPHILSSRFIFGILSDSENGFSFGPYLNQIAYHTSRRLFDVGFNVQIFSSRQLPYLHKNAFRGVILLNPRYASQMLELGIPTVLVNHFAEGIHSVATDHREGLMLAVRHLVKNGHRRIAFLRFKEPNWGSDQRELGYRDAMAEAGIAPEGLMIGSYDSVESIPASISFLLKQNPTALIVEGEDNGPAVNYSMFLLNRKIPDELSLITFENGTSSLMTPPQTTIYQDFAALGTLAADTVIRLASSRKKNADVPMIQILGNRLIERQSVRNIGNPGISGS